MVCPYCEESFERGELCACVRAARQRAEEQRVKIYAQLNVAKYETREAIEKKWPIHSNCVVMIQSRKRPAIVISHSVLEGKQLIWCWSEGWGLCPYQPYHLLLAEASGDNGQYYV